MIDVEEDLRELKRLSKGKLLEFLNQVFVDKAAAKEILNGIRVENNKLHVAARELLKVDASKADTLIKKLTMLDEYVKFLNALLNKPQPDREKIIYLCAGFVQEMNQLEPLLQKTYSKSFLEKIRGKQSAIAKFLGIFGIATALTAGDVQKNVKVNPLPDTPAKAMVVNAEPVKYNPLALSVISTASKEIGKRYLYGRLDEKGNFHPDTWDCSSLVKHAFSKNGVPLEGNSRTLSGYGKEIVKRQMDFTKLMPGDLLFFTFDRNRPRGHVGIYVGDGKMIQAGTSTGVAIVRLDTSYYKKGFQVAKRILN